MSLNAGARTVGLSLALSIAVLAGASCGGDEAPGSDRSSDATRSTGTEAQDSVPHRSDHGAAGSDDGTPSETSEGQGSGTSLEDDGSNTHGSPDQDGSDGNGSHSDSDGLETDVVESSASSGGDTTSPDVDSGGESSDGSVGEGSDSSDGSDDDSGNGTGGDLGDDNDGGPGDGSDGNPGDGSDGEPGDGSDGEPGDGSDGTGDEPEPAPVLVQPPFFELTMPSGLEDVWFNWDLTDYLSYGAGMAFVDTRAIGTFDLFIGSYNDGDAPPCLYRNVSTPGEPAFEPVEEICGQIGRYMGGLPVDLTGDGREELFLYGLGSAGLLLFHPEVTYLPLHVRGEEEGPMSECLAVSSLAVDLMLDGVPEIVVGCAGLEQASFAEHVVSPDFRGVLAFSRNVVFRWTGETLEAVEGPAVDALRDIGSSLAMAPIELDADGRDAIVMANESNSTPLRRRTWLREAVVQFRCLGVEPCVFDEWPLVPGNEAWGSFMGAGKLYIGSEPFIYLTDWGHNRLIRRNGDHFVDEALQRGARLGIRGGHLVVGWSVLVDDLNFSGRDDILVSNGLVLGDISAWAAQEDTLLLQQEDGSFLELTTEAGLRGPEATGEEVLGEPYNARGGALVDLDGNGRLEVVLLNLAGRLIVYRERAPITDDWPPAARCCRGRRSPPHWLRWWVFAASTSPPFVFAARTER